MERFLVPPNVVAHTEHWLRDAGERQLELFVFWTGLVDGPDFTVHASHVPEQTSYRTEDGLLVRVAGPELHRLNVWLHEHGQVLGAQIHAHPTRAYHSNTDDTFPVMTTLGGLSLVVPDFCHRGLLRGSAAYRLCGSGWVKSERPVERLIELSGR